ncbi:MAG: hemolysin family protein [Prochlorotrichaceae cyanobacterium]
MFIFLGASFWLLQTGELRPLLGNLWLDLGVLVAMVSLSALFSGSETAITSLDDLKLQALIQEQGDPQRIFTLALKNRNRFIITLLVGNNLVNNFSAILTSNLFALWLGNAGVGIATAMITILLLIFGEITPKSIAINNQLPVFKAVVRPIYGLMRFLSTLGIIQILEKIAEKAIRLFHTPGADEGESIKDLQLMVEILGGKGKINLTQKDLLQRTLKLNQTTVRSVLKPRIDMETLAQDMTLDQALAYCLESGYSRLPVQGNSKDIIVGIVHLKQVLQRLQDPEQDNANVLVTTIMDHPTFVPETKAIVPLLKEMLHQRIHLAIVVDEYGGTVGLITLEDLLEEIVGEIYDESDSPPPPFAPNPSSNH